MKERELVPKASTRTIITNVPLNINVILPSSKGSKKAMPIKPAMPNDLTVCCLDVANPQKKNSRKKVSGNDKRFSGNPDFLLDPIITLLAVWYG